MLFDRMLAATHVSSSGLSAERLRMEVIANNIANANSTRSAAGGPYRRQEVVFAAALNDQLAHGARGGEQLGGVQIVGIVDDAGDFPRHYQPGHPDADSDGFVLMPNVHLPVEMVNLITASRAYEANLKVLTSFRQMAENSIAIIRS